MLVIRMQRTGRKGHAQFRVVVQDSRRTPTSGKIVASLGFFNPHTKETSVDKEKASFYLEHGAQPSERVARLLKSQGVKLPKWVVVSDVKSKNIKNNDKLRKNRPAEEVEAKPAKTEESSDAPVEAEATEAADDDSKVAEETEEVKTEEKPAE